MADRFRDFQALGTPFAAYIVRQALSSQDPLKGYIWMEAIKRLWKMVIRYVSKDQLPDEFYLMAMDDTALVNALTEKGLLHDERAGRLMENPNFIQVLKLAQGFSENVLSLDFVESGEWETLESTADLLVELIKTGEPVPMMGILAGNGEQGVRYIGASNYIVLDDIFDGTFLDAETEVLSLAPHLGDQVMALLPTGRPGVFEDIQGSPVLAEGGILAWEHWGSAQAILGKNLVFQGVNPTEAIKALIDKDLEIAASSVAVWGALLGDNTLDLLETVSSYPQVITEAFTRLFDQRLRSTLDEAVKQAKTDDKAQEVLRYLLIKQAIEPDTSKKIETLSALANLYEEKLGDKEGLFYTSCRLFDMEPDTGETLSDLIHLAKDLGKQVELADFLVETADQRDRELSAELLTQAAVLYLENDRREEAEQVASEALGMEPASQQTLIGLCGIFERLGGVQMQKQCMQRRLESATRRGDRVSIHLDLGNLLKSRLNDRKAAVHHYREAFDLEPGNEQVFEALKNELLEQGKVEEVTELYTKALANALEPRVRTRLLRGYIHLADEVLKDYQKTIGLLRELLAIQPEAFKEAKRLMELYFQAGHKEEAVGLGWAIALRSKDRELLDQVLEQAGPLKRLWILKNSGEVLGEDTLEAEIKALKDAGLLLDAAKKIEEAAGKAEQERAAQLYMQAGELYEASTGSLEKMAECYERAYKILPTEENIDKLASIYKRLGKNKELYMLLHRSLDKVKEPEVRAKLLGWIGEIAANEMGDPDVAIQYLEQALDLVPTNFGIAEQLCSILSQKGDMEKVLIVSETAIDTATKIGNGNEAERFTLIAGKAALKIGDLPKAVRYLEGLKNSPLLGPDLLIALGRAYTLTNRPQEAKQVLQDVLSKYGQQLDASDRATVLEELGDAAVGDEKFELALKFYTDCKKAMPGNKGVIKKALNAAEKANDYYAVADILEDISYRTEDQEELFTTLIKLGDIYSQRLKRLTEAKNAYEKALSMKPDSRGVMHRLLQLYVETGEYEETSRILMKLLRIEEDGTKRANYHHTAGMLALEHLNDKTEALKHFEQTLSYDPSNKDVLEITIRLLTEEGRLDDVVNLLKKQAVIFKNMGDKTLEIDMLERLKELYEGPLQNPVRAAEVMEEIAQIKGKTPDMLQKIAEGYARVRDHAAKALSVYMEILDMDPTRKEVYHSVKDIYRNMGDMDAYWSVCGVLSVLGLAKEEERKYYMEHKQAALRLTKDKLPPEDFNSLVASHYEDRSILRLLELMWPALRQTLVWKQPSEVGITANNLVDLNKKEAFETIYRITVRLLGIKAPRAYVLKNAKGITKVPFNPPALVIGEDVYKGSRGKDLRFLLGRHLSLFTPGRVPFGVLDVKVLTSALTAVTKICFPNFVIPSEAKEAHALVEPLSQKLQETTLDQIRKILSRFRREHRMIDFEAQAAAVDMTAVHMGLFMSNDIMVAMKMVNQDGKGFSNLQTADLLVELTRYACSPGYMQLRKLMLKR